MTMCCAVLGMCALYMHFFIAKVNCMMQQNVFFQQPSFSILFHSCFCAILQQTRSHSFSLSFSLSFNTCLTSQVGRVRMHWLLTVKDKAGRKKKNWKWWNSQCRAMNSFITNNFNKMDNVHAAFVEWEWDMDLIPYLILKWCGSSDAYYFASSSDFIEEILLATLLSFCIVHQAFYYTHSSKMNWMYHH